MGEIYFNLFLFVVSIAGLINTLSWQVIKDTSGGPATYPRIILTALLACSLIRIIQILKQKKEERPDFIFMDLFKGLSLIHIFKAGRGDCSMENRICDRNDHDGHAGSLA